MCHNKFKLFLNVFKILIINKKFLKFILFNQKFSLEVPPTPRQPTSQFASNNNINNNHNNNSSSATSATAINPTDSRWISSLRRRDPEIQPTLPSINHHLSNSSVGFMIPNDKRGRSGKISSSIRKSRSVERFRARKVRITARYNLDRI